jgi:hypothetical protein
MMTHSLEKKFWRSSGMGALYFLSAVAGNPAPAQNAEGGRVHLLGVSAGFHG